MIAPRFRADSWLVASRRPPRSTLTSPGIRNAGARCPGPGVRTSRGRRGWGALPAAALRAGLRAEGQEASKKSGEPEEGDPPGVTFGLARGSPERVGRRRGHVRLARRTGDVTGGRRSPRGALDATLRGGRRDRGRGGRRWRGRRGVREQGPVVRASSGPILLSTASGTSAFAATRLSPRIGRRDGSNGFRQHLRVPRSGIARPVHPPLRYDARRAAPSQRGADREPTTNREAA